MNKYRQSGFTLLEMMTVVAIVGILSVAGTTAYHHYQAKATSVELLLFYNSLKQHVIEQAADQGIDLCGDPPMSLANRYNHTSSHATLSFMKHNLSSNSKPLVLSVVANAFAHGKNNVSIVREAYNSIKGNNDNLIASDLVLENIVAFNLYLTDRPCSNN